MTFLYRLIKELKEHYILHPFLIIFYFLLHNYLSFNEPFKFYELIEAMLIVLLFSFMLRFIIQKIIPDKFNATYLVSFITIFFLFYDDIRQMTTHIFTFQTRNQHFLLFILFCILSMLIYLRRSTRLYQPNLFLNCLLIIYLLIDFNSLLTSTIKLKSSSQFTIRTNKLQTDNLPDIYLLLVDGYGSNQNFKRYYHFNNDKFIDSLKKLNFKIIEHPKSNYFLTSLTMSSALNLRYHTAKQRNVQSEFRELIEENVFTQSLEKHGYEINNLSIFQIKNHPTKYGLKIWLNKSSLPFYYFSKTLLFAFYTIKKRGEGFTRELNIFNVLADLTKTKNQKPKFIYAHTLLPHVPFYLNNFGEYDKKVEDSSLLSGIDDLLDNDPHNNTMGSPLADSSLKVDYINHIKFANKKCLEAISAILKNNKRPPIIILMSDHGSRMLTNPIPNIEAVKERYDNMCAIYYPDKDYSKLYDSITPINVMRQVLNKSIGTKYPNLKDISGLVVE